MNMTTLVYLESNPGNPLMNMTMVMEGISDLQYTYIGARGGGLDPMIIIAIVIVSAVAVVVIIVAVVVKKRRARS